MTHFREVARASRKCEREHELNGGRWCAVELPGGEIVVRSEDKAGRMCRKHPEYKVVCSVPGAGEVAS